MCVKWHVWRACSSSFVMASPPSVIDNVDTSEALLSGKLSAMAWYMQYYALKANDICGIQCADLHGAMLAGNCNTHLLNFLVDYFKLTEEDVCGREHQVLQGLVRHGHKDLVEYLIRKFQLTQSSVCGADNCAFYGAVLGGHCDLLKSLVTIFGMCRQ